MKPQKLPPINRSNDHSRKKLLAKSQSENLPRRSRPRMLQTHSDIVHYRRGRVHPRGGFLQTARSFRRWVPWSGSKTAAWLQLFSLGASAVLLLMILSTPLPEEGEEVKYTSEIRGRIKGVMRQGGEDWEDNNKASSVITEFGRGKGRKRKGKGGKQYAKPRQLGVLKRGSGRVEAAGKGGLHEERIIAGTFREAVRIGLWNVGIVGKNARRFDVPWLLWGRVETKGLRESGYRVLYSTVKQKGTDGLGHGMTVVNAEVSTALSLGLAYTHRVGSYGSISDERGGVERLFGWGVGEVPRRFIEEEVCEVEGVWNGRERPNLSEDLCPFCRRIKSEVLGLQDIVEVPGELSYGCVSCGETQRKVQEFLGRYTRNHTLFQMETKKCDQRPKSPDFKLSYRYFYWKYWDLHGDEKLGRMDGGQSKEEGGKWRVSVQRRDSVRLREGELNVGVHVRRGDFVYTKNRRMISLKVMRNVIWEVMRVVRKEGGVFSRMPVCVIVYSEGRRTEGVQGDLHDVNKMDKVFVDVDGQVRDARYFHEMLLGRNGEVRARGNETHSERTEWEYGGGLRVEMRVSGSVIDAVHEMASADVFVGSASDLSQYAVRMVARGIVLLPEYLGGANEGPVVRFHGRSGSLKWGGRLEHYWKVFARANEASASRAFDEQGQAGTKGK